VSRLLFGYGAASEDVDLVALTLAAFVPGLIGFTTTFLVQRAFYAQEDTRTPVLVQLIVSAVQISLSVTIVPTLDPVYVATGLAASWSIATLCGAIGSLVLLRRRVGRLGGASLAGFLLVVAVAAVPGTLVVLVLTRTPEVSEVESVLGTLVVLAGGTVVAALSYLALALALRVAPVRDGVGWVRARIGHGG
jgi:putative peptidoglycan lipid II flippase